MGPALSPAVHGTRTFFRRILPLHLLGQLLGGLLLGLLAAFLGLGLRAAFGDDAVTWAVVGLIAAYAISELSPRRLWRPNSHWQVPEGFRRTRYVGSMSFLWGIGLGAGWPTISVTSAFLVCFLALLAGPPEMALLAGALFGLVRGSTLLLSLGTDDFERLIQRFGAPGLRMRQAHIVSAVMGVALAATLGFDL